jgi:sporulation protein YabP
MDEKLSKKHIITLIDRERLAITGVTDVFSFDEELIALETVEGFLDIEGEELHIVKMSLDNGELNVEGRVQNITYQESNAPKKKSSLFGNMFR